MFLLSRIKIHIFVRLIVPCITNGYFFWRGGGGVVWCTQCKIRCAILSIHFVLELRQKCCLLSQTGTPH